MRGTWDYVVLIVTTALAICLVAGVLNSIFDDSPRQPREPSAHEKAVQTCINRGGVPIMAANESWRLEDCKTL